MRQRPQSALRMPLNRILGTQTKVRILRALTRRGHAMGAVELAQNTRRQISGMRRACAALVSTGIVEALGAPRSRLYRLRDSHPLAPAVRSLFRVESNRPQRIAAAVRTAVRCLERAPAAVWLQGRSATGGDREKGPVIVGVLAGARELDRLVRHLRKDLEDFETAEDLTIVVRGFTRTDLETLPPAEQQEIAGSSPVLGLPRLAHSHLTRQARGRVRHMT